MTIKCRDNFFWWKGKLVSRITPSCWLAHGFLFSLFETSSVWTDRGLWALQGRDYLGERAQRNNVVSLHFMSQSATLICMRLREAQCALIYEIHPPLKRAESTGSLSFLGVQLASLFVLDEELLRCSPLSSRLKHTCERVWCCQILESLKLGIKRTSFFHSFWSNTRFIGIKRMSLILIHKRFIETGN